MFGVDVGPVIYITGGLITALFLFMGTVIAAILTFRSASATRQASASVEERKAKIDEVDQVLTGQSAYIKVLENRIAAQEAKSEADYNELFVRWQHCEADKDELKARVLELERLAHGD